MGVVDGITIAAESGQLRELEAERCAPKIHAHLRRPNPGNRPSAIVPNEDAHANPSTWEAT